MSLRQSIPFFVVGILLTGCADSTKDTGATTAGGPAVDPAKITLQDTTIAGLTAEVAKHQGKVVLIDVWFKG